MYNYKNTDKDKKTIDIVIESSNIHANKYQHSINSDSVV